MRTMLWRTHAPTDDTPHFARTWIWNLEPWTTLPRFCCLSHRKRWKFRVSLTSTWTTRSIIFSFFSVTQNPLCLLILEMRHFAWNLLGCYTLPVHATRRLVTFTLGLTDQSQLERERCGLKAIANKLSAVRFRTASSNMVVNQPAGYRIYLCN